MAKMQAPRFMVTLDGSEPFEVTVPMSVQIKWDLERQRRNWPAMGEAPTLWMVFLCWEASRRAGHVEKAMPFEAFSDLVESVEALDVGDVDPTQLDTPVG